MSERNPDGQVRCEVIDERILLMTCDRVEKRNALTPSMMEELIEAYTRLDEDDALWAGVLTFAGDHTTGGIDLPKWTNKMESGEGFIEPTRVDPYSLGRRCRKPITTAVKGITYTWGIEVALGGDIIIAGDDCRFSQLEPARSVMAFGGGSFRFVERAGWGNAMYHLLTADVFGADEAYRIGLVQEVVRPGHVEDRALEIARHIVKNAPLAVRATKANAATFAEKGEKAAIAEFGVIMARLSTSNDGREGVQSFVERREARFTGT